MMQRFENPVNLLVKARYQMCPDALFERACCFGDMMESTRPLSSYRGLPAARMEVGRVYRTDVRVFGLFGPSDYEIRIESICNRTRRIETSESGDSVHSWSHTMDVVPEGDGAVWIDRVTIDAGRMTPVVARYARFMYRHRHARRQAESIWTSMNRSCRVIDRDMPVFHPSDRELVNVAAPLAFEETVIAFPSGAPGGSAPAKGRARAG